MEVLARANGGGICGICNKQLTPNVYNPPVIHEGEGIDEEHAKFHFSCAENRAIEQLHDGTSFTCPIDHKSLRFTSRNSLLSRREHLRLAATTAAYTALIGLTTSLLGIVTSKLAATVSVVAIKSLGGKLTQGLSIPLTLVAATAQVGAVLEFVGAEMRNGPGDATVTSALLFSAAAIISTMFFENATTVFLEFVPSTTALVIGGGVGCFANQMLAERAVPLDDRNRIRKGIFSSTGLFLAATALPILGLPSLTTALALPAITLFGSMVAFLKSM